MFRKSLLKVNDIDLPKSAQKELLEHRQDKNFYRFKKHPRILFLEKSDNLSSNKL